MIEEFNEWLLENREPILECSESNKKQALEECLITICDWITSPKNKCGSNSCYFENFNDDLKYALFLMTYSYLTVDYNDDNNKIDFKEYQKSSWIFLNNLGYIKA